MTATRVHVSGIELLTSTDEIFGNRSVDESVAQAHLCGMTDLRTGRTCIRPARHPASCDFVSKDAALTIVGDDS